MSRIELARLSAEQLALLSRCRNRWEEIRTSTARADRASAEDGVKAAYRAARLAPPEQIVWCEGPLDVARSCSQTGRAIAGENVKSLIVDSVLRDVAYAVDASISSEVRTRISSTFRPHPPNQTSAAVTAAVTLRDPLMQERRFQFARRLLHRLRGGTLPRWMRTSLRDSSFSQHDAPALGIFEFFHDACGLQRQAEPLQGLIRVAANVGWIIPHARVCWLVERHHILRTDDRGRLHSANGPAIAFADGWAYYAWKGVALPAWMIERPQEITAARVDREHEPVVRRCMIDIMTPERFIREGDAVAVAEDDTGILWTKSWTTWDSWAAVQVRNGSPEPDGTYKQYFLQVPPTVQSARQAVAWTYGLTELEYMALKQRT